MIENYLWQEVDKINTKIVIYPGFHQGNGAGWEEKIRSFHDDWDSSYLWKNEVKLLASQNAGIVAVEGSSYVDVQTLTEYEKMIAWIKLPCRPGEINKEKVAYVVRGDIKSSLDEHLCAFQEDEPISFVREKLQTAGFIEGSHQFFLSLFYLGFAYVAWKNALEHDNQSAEEITTITRRRFLKLSLAFFATVTSSKLLGTAGSFLLGYFGQQAKSLDELEFIENLENILDSATLDWETWMTNYIDCRTAILIQKALATQGYLKQMGKSNLDVAIPIGYAHLHSSSKLLNSEKERLDAIARHIRDLQLIEKMFLDYFPGIEFSKIDYSTFYKFNLIEIRDPSIIFKDDVDVGDERQIYESISIVGNFEDFGIKAMIEEQFDDF